MKINYFSPDESNFFQIISTIAQVPKRLWLLGKMPEQRAPTVAIVGTRRPTAYGRELTYKLAYELAQRGVIVVSGLALGVDSIAHRAALDAGGTTIAVMPGGLDSVYPRSHYGLAQEIVQKGGALISEYEPGTKIYPINFIARNRIVSGISDGLLVVEASAKSGTMHTAGFALDQGRAVMAVPGNVTSPVSAGCHNLIKTGARLVTDVTDILEEVGLSGEQASLPLGSNAAEQSLLTLLQQGVRHGEELQVKSQLVAAEFAQTLTMLEVTGKIKALGGNQWGLGR